MLKREYIFVILLGVILMSALIFRSNESDKDRDSQSEKDDQGTTETISYQTSYQHKEYSKKALVYLPKNYDDKKEHDIVYLMHGSSEAVDDFYQDGNFQQILDGLDRNADLKNTIVVFPTYYPSRKFVSSDYYPDRPLNKAFAEKELTEDLMPAVEQKYHTFAKTADSNGFKQSRAHRAFGGFSMGAITTWYVFENDLNYFSSFLPMAGDSWTITEDGGIVATKRTADKLAEQVEPNLPFKIMAAVGVNDSTSISMTPQIEAMWKLPEFNHDNLQYYKQKSGSHSPQSSGKQFEHYAKKIF